MDQDTNKTEQRIARKIVARCLAKGFSLSVYDGEVWTVAKATNAKEVLDALATTCDDTLRVHREDGTTVGNIWFVWGNGEDLVSDWSWKEGAEGNTEALMQELTRD